MGIRAYYTVEFILFLVLMFLELTIVNQKYGIFKASRVHNFAPSFVISWFSWSVVK